MDAPKVFLNHAKEDTEVARRLYEELTARGVDVWFDKESLLPGQTWKLEIKKAIRACDYFILVFSSKSVDKTGYVNVEIREAFEQAKRRPPGDIYIIPVRLDECEVNFPELEDLQWVDLFAKNGSGEIVDRGIKKIADVITRSTPSFVENENTHIELEGLKKIEKLLIEKRIYFATERIVTSDPELKFSLKKKLEEIEKELVDVRGKMGKISD